MMDKAKDGRPAGKHRSVPARYGRFACRLHQVALALCFGVLLAGAAQAQSADTLFGRRGVPSTRIQIFPKWNRVLSEHSRDQDRMPTECQNMRSGPCSLRHFFEAVESLAGLPPERQLDRVNALVNQTRYIEDIDNWAIPDYWATPLEFLLRYGDCEDFAIAKYMALRHLGWSAARMQVVVLYDLNLRITHAVLAVRSGNTQLILDNQVDSVMPDRRIRHYVPVYSVNEERWWKYR